MTDIQSKDLRVVFMIFEPLWILLVCFQFNSFMRRDVEGFIEEVSGEEIRAKVKV